MFNPLYIQSNYGFFSDGATQTKANTFFNKYIKLLTSKNKGANPDNLRFQMIPLQGKLINYLEEVNKITDSDVKFNINKNINNVLIPLPDLSRFSNNYSSFGDAKEEFNKINKGKVYKALIPKGENWYSVADVSLALSEEKVEYETIINGKKVKRNKSIIKPVVKSLYPVYDLEIIKEDSELMLSSNGAKVLKKIRTSDENGIIRSMNADYYEFINRMIQTNTSVSKSSSVSQNDDLLKITAQKGAVNKSSNMINAFYDSNKEITAKGVMQTSKRTINTRDVYLTGGSLNISTGRNIFSGEDENAVFHLTLSVDNENKIESIERIFENSEKPEKIVSPFDENGGFVNEDMRTLWRTSKKDLFDQVGVNDEMLKKALIFENVSLEDKKGIPSLNKRATKIIERKDKAGAYALARDIVTNYQNRVLEAYPFVPSVDENGNVLTAVQRVQNFYSLYNSIEDKNVLMEKVYNKLTGDLSVGVIANDILSGRLFNTFNQLEKQSQVTGGVENVLSPGVAQHNLHYLIPFTQRKGQSADRPKKYIMNINDQEINVSKTIQGFFSHIPEYSHKKYNVTGKEFPEIIDRFGNKIRVKSEDIMETTSNIGMMAYTYTDAAWLDSSRYDSSILTGMVSELDNKGPIVVPYSGLHRFAFGYSSDEMVSNFIKELEIKKYNFDDLSDESKQLAETLFKNILGQENYDKYKLGFSTHVNENGEQINNIWSDLEKVGKPLTDFHGSIFNGQENEFVKAKQKFIANLNNWYDKYFFKSDVNSNINIFDPERLNKGITTSISGTHYAFLNGIQFTNKGISFDFQRVSNIGESEKIMNDTIKSTVQGVSNLLFIKDKNGTKRLVEGFINEQFNKEKRAFAPVMITRLLTGAAMSALDAEYADSKSYTLEQKFNKFKEALSGKLTDGYDDLTDQQKKLHNIFELLNIDMEFDSVRKEIIFTDKNTQAALLESQTDKYSSFDSLLLKNINEHWEKLYGHKIAEEEGRVLGLSFFETIHSNYEKLLQQFDKKYAKSNVHFLKEATAYKDTIDANGNVKIVPMGELKHTILIPTDTGIMSEVKKRKNEGGLKFGPLTKMITNESGNQFLGDYFTRQAVRNAPKNIGDFLFALAPHGSEYSRGRKFFQNYSTVGNIIDINNTSSNYAYHGINNLTVDEFLNLSPIGRIADYDSVEKRLNKNITGVIKNFDNEFVGELRSFFDHKNLDNLKFTSSKAAQMFVIDSLINETNLSETGKKELVNKLQRYINDSERNFNEIVQGKPENAKLNSLINTYTDMYKKQSVRVNPFIINNDKIGADLSGGAKAKNVIKSMVFDMVQDFSENGNLTKEERQAIFKGVGKGFNPSDNMQNVVKFFSSLINVQQILGVAEGDLSKTNSDVFIDDNFSKAFYDFNLDKNIVHKLKTYSLGKMNDKLNPNFKMINNLLNNVDFINNGQISNISEMYDFSFDGTVPFVIDSLASDINGNLISNKFINTYDKVVRTATELRELTDIKKLYSDEELYGSLEYIAKKIFDPNYKFSISKEKIGEIYRKLNPSLFNAFDIYRSKINPEDSKKFNRLFNEITDTIAVSNKDIFEIDRFYIGKIFSDLSFKQNAYKPMIDKNGRRVSTNWKDDPAMKEVLSEIRKKMNDYRAIANNKNSSNIKSSILKNFMNNMGITEELSFTDVQSQIIRDSFSNNFFNYENFSDAVESAKQMHKHENNIYADIIEVEELVNSSIKNVITSKINPVQKVEEELISMIGSGNASYEDISNKLAELKSINELNPIRNLKGYFLTKDRKSIVPNLDKKIENTKGRLFSLVFKRNQNASQWMDKEGPLYELGTNVIKSSAAFSPTDGSHITTFMEYEMLDILEKKKKAKTITDKKAVVQSYEDFKKAIKFTYGDFLPETELRAFEKIYSGDLKDFDLVKSQVREIKEKFDKYSRVVFGTKETYEQMGLDYLFEFEDGRRVNSIKAMLSRNPHQYKNSLAHVRLLMLDDEYRNLSFWGKYKGSSVDIDAPQSHLSLIGKKTGLDANADYDGDTMQIVALGKTSRIKDKYFAEMFDRGSEVDYMLRNMTGEDLESIFYGLDAKGISVFGDTSNNKYKHLAQRIFYAYGGRYNSKTSMFEFNGESFEKQKDIKFKNIYDFIEDKYLSMVNEDIRVSRNLADEIKDHAAVPEIGGFYTKDKIKISRSAVADFISTLGGEDRLKVLSGDFSADDLSRMITNNDKMLSDNKNALKKILKTKKAKEFLVDTVKSIPNDKKSAIIKAAILSGSSYNTGTGIANTGEVHNKFTSYRYVTSVLSSDGYEDNLIEQIKKVRGNLIDEARLRKTYNGAILRNAFFGHDIGTIVEKLAVSAKKGTAASHKRIGDAFKITEEFIRDEKDFSVIVNFENIGKMNKKLQKEYLKYGSETAEIISENSYFNNVLNNTFEEFFEKLFEQNQKLKEAFITKKDMFGEDVEINIFDTLQENFLKMMFSYTDDDVYEVMKNKNTITLREVLAKDKGKNLKRYDLINILGDWSAAASKGTLERDFDVEDITRFDYDKTMASKRGIYERFSNFVNLFNNNAIGFRFHTSIYGNVTDKDLLEYSEKKAKSDIESYNKKNDMYSDEFEVDEVEKTKSLADEQIHFESIYDEQYEKEKAYIVDQMDSADENLSEANKRLDNIKKYKKEIEQISSITDEEKDAYYAELQRKSKLNDTTETFVDFTKKTVKETNAKKQQVNNLSDEAKKTLKNNKPSPFVRTGIRQDQSVRAKLPKTSQQIEAEYPFVIYETDKSFYNQEIQNRLQHNKNDFSKKQLKRELQADLNIPENAKIKKVNGFIPKNRVDMITGTDYDGNAVSGRKKWTKGRPQADIEWEYDGYKYYSQVQIVDGKWRGDIYKLKIDDKPVVSKIKNVPNAIETVDNVSREVEKELTKTSEVIKNIEKQQEPISSTLDNKSKKTLIETTNEVIKSEQISFEFDNKQLEEVKASKESIENSSKINKPIKASENLPDNNQSIEIQNKLKNYKKELDKNKQIIEKQKEVINSAKEELQSVKQQYSKAIDVINERSDSKINILESINKISSEKISSLETDVSSKEARINNLLEQMEKEKKLHAEQISELELKHAEEIKNKDKIILDNENKAKAVLEKTKKDYDAVIGETEAKYTNKFDQLNIEYDNKVEDILNKRTSDLDIKTDEISKLTEQLEEQRKIYSASTKGFESQIKDLKEKHKIKIGEISDKNKSSHMDEIKDLKEKHRTRIEEINEKNKINTKSKLDKLKENHKSKIEELNFKNKEKIKQLKEENKVRIKEINDSKKDEIKKITVEKNEEIKNVKKQLEEEKSKLIKEINSNKKVSETLANEKKNVNNLQAELEEARKSAKELQIRYEREKAQLIQKHKSELNDVEESKKIEINKISKEKEREVLESQKRFEAEKESIINDAREYKKKKDKEITELTRQLNAEKNEKEKVISKARKYKENKDKIISEMVKDAEEAKKNVQRSEEQIKNIRSSFNKVNDKLKETEKANKNAINEYENTIKQLKKENKQAILELQNKHKEEIKQLNAQISQLSSENNSFKQHSKVLNKAKKTIQDTGEILSNATENVTSSAMYKTMSGFAKEHKKALAVAGGVAVLAGFFRIFQSNRPVVNLDINEQEYERSQGSVYRNLGQYTMNTNIRSLY